MMMRSVLLTLSLLCGAGAVCQPCESTLSLDESISRADLIVVGRRTDFIDWDAEDRRKPERINVEVIAELKGEAGGKEIKVRGWYGMCPYGVIVGEGVFVMILEKDKEQGYAAVNWGCGVRTLAVSGEKVRVEGEEVPLKELKRKYKLKE